MVSNGYCRHTGTCADISLNFSEQKLHAFSYQYLLQKCVRVLGGILKDDHKYKFRSHVEHVADKHR